MTSLLYPTTWKLVNNHWRLRFSENVYVHNGITAIITVKDGVAYLTVTVPKNQYAYQTNYHCITLTFSDAAHLGVEIVRSLLCNEPRTSQMKLLTKLV